MKARQALENYISKAIENAESDRSQAQALLSELEEEMKEAEGKDPEKHERAGDTASKYLKVIQKSNDQIIKVIKALRKLVEKDQEGSNSSAQTNIYDDIEQVKLDQGDLESAEEKNGE